MKKRILALALTLAFILTLVPSVVPVVASTDYEWEIIGDSKISVSPETGTFIFENSDYTDAVLRRRVDIAAGGTYQVSVEIKLEDFYLLGSDSHRLGIGEIEDGEWYSRGGAGINLPNNEWTTISLMFSAINNDSVYLRLYSGFGKGKVTFRNLKIEKVDIISSSTEWNVLAVFFDKFDITIQQPSQRTEYIREDVKSEVDFTKRSLKTLPNLFAKVTGSRATIKNIDIIDISSPLTKEMDSNPNNDIGINPYDVLPHIETRLQNNQYDKVLVFFPLESQTAYATGALYMNGVYTYFSSYPLNGWDTEDWGDEKENWLHLLITHELLHCVEEREHLELGKPNRVWGGTLGTMTWLHSWLDYSFPDDGLNYDWLRDYAQNLLPDKSGLPAEAFRANRYGVVTNIPLGNITFAQNANVTNLDQRPDPETRTITATFGAPVYKLDGEAFEAQALTYNGVAYLPAAFLARKLGIHARWDGVTNITYLTSTTPVDPASAVAPAAHPAGTRQVTVTIGAPVYMLDGKPLTEQALTYNGVAYLPAAYFARTLGLTARWDAATNITNLTSG
jgi:ribosomal protein L20A (L18A)